MALFGNRSAWIRELLAEPGGSASRTDDLEIGEPVRPVYVERFSDSAL